MEILTIAIPSFNSSRNIISTIKSINMSISSKNEKLVKILICDNGSDPKLDTFLNISDLSGGSKVELISFKENLGYDLNIIRMLKFVFTEYVWLMGDDDLIINKSLDDLVINLQSKKRNVVVMKPIYEGNSMCAANRAPEGIEFSKGFLFFREVFLDSSLLSTLVFRLDSAINFSQKYIGTNWVHVAILGKLCSNDKYSYYQYTSPCVLRINSNPERWQSQFNSNLISGLNHIAVLFHFRKMLRRCDFLFFVDNRMPRPKLFLRSLKLITKNKFLIVFIYLYYKVLILYTYKTIVKFSKILWMNSKF